MKNKLKLQLILVLTILLLGATIAGCSIGMDSLEDVLQKNELTARITYYSNGGYFNNDTNSLSRDIYYKENSKALELTDATQTKINHAEDIYAGWYTIQTLSIQGESYFVCNVSADELDNFQLDGNNAVVQSNGKYVIKIDDYQKLADNGKAPLLALEEQFDFSGKTLAKDEHVYLATMWLPNQKVEYVLITEDCSSITVKNSNGTNTVYQNGDIVASKTFDANGVFAVPTNYSANLWPVKATDATFVDYYVYDQNATVDNLTLLIDTTTSITRPESGNVKIFVKYVAGNWNVARVANDVKDIFNNPYENHYVARDIDCADVDALYTVSGNFSGILRGNGHTITGATFNRLDMTNGTKVALFGGMTSTTSITDVTFANVTCNFSTRTGVRVDLYLVAHTVGENVTPTMENVRFDNVTVNVTLRENASINNILQGNDGFDTTKLLFADTTNDNFVSAYPTVEIENYTLVINDDTIVNNKTFATIK